MVQPRQVSSDEAPTGPINDRSEAALIAIRRIFRATEISSRALAKESKLTPSQLILLQVVLRAGKATPGALAKQVSLSQATVTALIDRLEARGLLCRRKDSQDKRRVLVELTPSGQAALSSAPPILHTRFENRFALLADWEQAYLVSALERVAAMLDAEDIDAAPVLDLGGIGTLTD